MRSEHKYGIECYGIRLLAPLETFKELKVMSAKTGHPVQFLIMQALVLGAEQLGIHGGERIIDRMKAYRQYIKEVKARNPKCLISECETGFDVHYQNLANRKKEPIATPALQNPPIFEEPVITFDEEEPLF